MDAPGVFAVVVVLADHGVVEPGVGDADRGPSFSGFPGEAVHAVAEGHGLAFTLLHAHGEELGFRPVPEHRLDAFGDGLRRAGGVGAGDLVGAVDGDGLVAAEDVRDESVDEHAGVAELTAFPCGAPVEDRGDLAGLVVVVRAEHGVRSKPSFVVRGHPGGVGLGERATVRHAAGVVGVDRLEVQPGPGVDDYAAGAGEGVGQAAHRASLHTRPRAM